MKQHLTMQHDFWGFLKLYKYFKIAGSEPKIKDEICHYMK
jgi:hypothetical protein